MGSRLKQNPERTFHWFFEAACPIARDKDPNVLFQFPENFDDEDSSQTLPRFCFPYDIKRAQDGVAVQHFTVVLTDLEGCQRFGFCRLNSSCKTCLCILSYLPWFEVFYKLLNNLADYLTKGQTNEMKDLLATLYKQSIPLTAGSVTLQMGEQLVVSTEGSLPDGQRGRQKGVPYFIAPDPRGLPSIPESRNLTELMVAVDVRNLLQLYASILFERRILIFASKLSTLAACVHALTGILYPMHWQHIFIPVLPAHLLDYCCAPMPYLIGVHASLMERVRCRGLEEVVILNVDTNTLESPFDDLKKIPSDVMSELKVCLKRYAASPGCGVARAFLRAQALLFGGYKNALQRNQEGTVWFCEELFLDHSCSSMKQFLQSAVHLQFFKQFIDSRLEQLNEGQEPDDLFEEQIHRETVTGTKKSYQEFVGSLKKGGGALIITMRSKANITAKSLTKPRFKNILHTEEQGTECPLQRGGSVSQRRNKSEFLQWRLPITQHFGTPRPRRPAQKHRTPRSSEKAADTQVNWQGVAAEPCPELERDEVGEDDSLLCDPEEMDLLGEIFETLSSRSTREHGLLYGTRSLDLFGPDSHDFIMKDRLATPSQESLSLSISGSESLHSWTLEETLQTAEEESVSPMDLEWLCPNPEWKADKEVKPFMCTLEDQGRIRANPNKQEEEDIQGQRVNEIVEKQREIDAGNNTDVETGQGEDVTERGSGKQTGDSVETQTDGLEEMIQEVNLNNEGTEIGPLQITRLGLCTESDVSPELVENQNQDMTNQEISIYVGEKNDLMSPDFQSTRTTSLATGKQQSPADQSVMLQKQSQTKLWRSLNSNNPPCVQDNLIECTEGELKAVKVSELKKRFEA
ncbi:DENN domain-containing protein 1B isoform X1 [Gadus macrocephalus]|uniref:DENN domain-containing protein 1B isoform X1 n=1 Tax=Gadus macrocephalus TaxID=80720 RepID=UPI0028CB2855|nr:DENN domain-containing protein 1B isoform X1 [Gadus macrocephalus]